MVSLALRCSCIFCWGGGPMADRRLIVLTCLLAAALKLGSLMLVAALVRRP